MWAVDKFKQFLAGSEFIVVTDHCALCWLQTKQNLPNRLARWSLQLQPYNYRIEYKSGKTHKDVDCLSRFPINKPENLDIRTNLDNFVGNINFGREPEINMKELQDEDWFCYEIMNILEHPENINIKTLKTIIAKYTIIDQVLYYRIITKKGPKLCLVIPKVLRQDILYNCHDDLLGGHLGYQKTLSKVRERFFWPDMNKYISNYVASCMDCQTKKLQNLPKAGLLCPIKVGGAFEMVGIDILGPFVKSHSGNVYVIVATDYLTKWIEVKATPTGTARDVSIFLVENILCRHGAPTKIISDRGAVFASQIMQELYHIMSTRHIMTTSYHP